MSEKAFRASMLLVVVLALVVRIAFLLGMDVQAHIAGDINDYVHYAWNLGQHGVYSSAAADPTQLPLADSFRPPGYPLFLLLCMWLAGFGSGWLAWAHALQILASATTVLLTMLLGRTWLKPGLSLLAGALLAVWPHHVVFASTLLSETLLGLCIVLALYLVTVAHHKRSVGWAAAAGIAFGYAALVNTLVALFPVLVAALLLHSRERRKLAFAFLPSFLAIPVLWLAMAPTPPSETPNGLDRAAMNLIQGSWPQYHLAWRTRMDNEVSQQIMDMISDEVALVLQDRPAGLASMSDRFAHDPTRFIRWYTLEKPWLLWDWDIRLGWHGIHFLPTTSSPFESNPALRVLHASMRAANPIIFMLAILAVLFLLKTRLRGHRTPLPAIITAGFTVYVTVLHALLQAEPRYSIAYRPGQLLLASTALSLLPALLASRREQDPEG